MALPFASAVLCLSASSIGAAESSDVSPGADDRVEGPVEPAEQAVTRVEERLQEIGNEGDDVVLGLAPEVRDAESTEFLLYGSARVRTSASNDKLAISDNRTRVGIYAHKFIRPTLELFSRIELGTDLGATLDDIIFPPENPRQANDGAFFLRIGKVGIGTKAGDFSIGKQWSVYYNISGYTDRFAVFGARATATYNAGTDGGGSGTGRADSSFKFQSFGKLAIGVQAQDNGLIPGANGDKYQGSAGASIEYEFSDRWKAGAAYNQAFIDELTPDLIALGLAGNSKAGVIGVQYTNEPFYLATTFASHENQETTDEGLFVDATGWELYGRYQLTPKLRAVGGFNYLDPDDADPNAGEYDIRSVVLGFQWAYRGANFGDIVYFECDIRNGRFFDGRNKENAYTVGFRYSFEL